MAIYFPSLFCGKGTTLVARLDFDIEFDDGHTMTITVGDSCIVDNIIGYGYNIKKEGIDKEFRIMDGTMPDFFDIIEKAEPAYDVEDFGYHENQGTVVTLQKDFEIKDVVKILRGQNFLSFIDRENDRIFHDLFSLENKAKTIRMKQAEFEEYFNNLSLRLT